MHLRIESANGSIVNDYRVAGHSVQVRSLDCSGQPVRGALGSWRRLDRNDIALHRALGTPVSKWIQVRVGDKVHES